MGKAERAKRTEETEKAETGGPAGRVTYIEFDGELLPLENTTPYRLEFFTGWWITKVL